MSLLIWNVFLPDVLICYFIEEYIIESNLGVYDVYLAGYHKIFSVKYSYCCTTA